MAYILKGKNRSGDSHYQLVIDRCWRCGGTGRYPSACFGGTCLLCGSFAGVPGCGQIGTYRPTPEWQAVLDARKAKRDAKKAAKLVVEKAAKLAALPGWVMGVALFAGLTGDQIALSVVTRLVVQGKPMTDRQAAAIFKAALKLAAPKPVEAPVVAGEGVEIKGEVLTVREQPGYMGRSELKMLVKDDRGFKVWGTAPRALWSCDRGARVCFVANVERSRDDEKFGFFKRPRRAAAI